MRIQTIDGFKLVRQRGRNDCGVASLAMIADAPYEAAHGAFLESGLGVARGRKAALSSNFAEICRAAQALGFPLAMRPFRSWDHIAQRAILKVMRQRSGNWHWVVAIRGPYGLQILDPASDLPSYQHPPLDVVTADFQLYQPCGNILMPADLCAKSIGELAMAGTLPSSDLVLHSLGLPETFPPEALPEQVWRFINDAKKGMPGPSLLRMARARGLRPIWKPLPHVAGREIYGLGMDVNGLQVLLLARMERVANNPTAGAREQEKALLF